MKFIAPFMFGLVTSAAVSRRQEDENDVDIGDACMAYKGTWTDNTELVVVTWTESPDFFAAILGDFNVNQGQELAHSFDNECNHLDSVNLEASGGGNGFVGSLSMSKGSVDVNVGCFSTACSSGTDIGEPKITQGGVDAPMLNCESDVTWVEGLDVYGYRSCAFLISAN